MIVSEEFNCGDPGKKNNLLLKQRVVNSLPGIKMLLNGSSEGSV